jgi:hypothetical protein
VKFSVEPPQKRPILFELHLQKDGRAADGGEMPVRTFKLTRLEVIKLRVALGRALEEKSK